MHVTEVGFTLVRSSGRSNTAATAVVSLDCGLRVNGVKIVENRHHDDFYVEWPVTQYAGPAISGPREMLAVLEGEILAAWRKGMKR